MKFIVNVTAADIKKGRPVDSRRCPLALATNRALKKAKIQVFVGSNFWASKYPWAIKMSKKVAAFREAFDIGEKVKPFSFTLTIPKQKAGE